MEGDRHVSGNRPRGGRPDDDEERLVSWQVELRRFLAGHRKLYPDCYRSVIFVFDLGFSQSGLEGNRPVNWFFAAKDDVLICK